MKRKLRIKVTPDGGEFIISENQIPELRAILPEFFDSLKKNGVSIITPSINPEIALTLCG